MVGVYECVPLNEYEMIGMNILYKPTYNVFDTAIRAGTDLIRPLHRVLIVDDEAIIAIDLSYTLEEKGYRIAGIAYDGKSAVKMALETRPDVIIMDIDLPGPIDGITAARLIQMKLYTRIIFASGHNDDDPRVRKVLDEGTSEFIHKPYSKDMVSMKIDEA
jgi:YesN/AraC family two-component response regulator